MSGSGQPRALVRLEIRRLTQNMHCNSHVITDICAASCSSACQCERKAARKMEFVCIIFSAGVFSFLPHSSSFLSKKNVIYRIIKQKITHWKDFTISQQVNLQGCVFLHRHIHSLSCPLLLPVALYSTYTMNKSINKLYMCPVPCFFPQLLYTSFPFLLLSLCPT